MIYVQENYLKVAGKAVPGMVETVDIREEGTIEDKKNKKGKVVKANVPQGFQAATVEIQMIFEESAAYDRDSMVQYVQRLFRTSGQKTQKKYRITEKSCSNRGITEVYFNGFTTTEIIGESFYRGTLTFVAPIYGGTKVVKTKKKKAKEAAKKKAKAKKKKAAAAKKKTKKKTSKSPARAKTTTKSAKTKAKTAAAKKKAKALVKTPKKSTGKIKRATK